MRKPKRIHPSINFVIKRNQFKRFLENKKKTHPLCCTPKFYRMMKTVLEIRIARSFHGSALQFVIPRVKKNYSRCRRKHQFCYPTGSPIISYQYFPFGILVCCSGETSLSTFHYNCQFSTNHFARRNELHLYATSHWIEILRHITFPQLRFTPRRRFLKL